MLSPALGRGFETGSDAETLCAIEGHDIGESDPRPKAGAKWSKPARFPRFYRRSCGSETPSGDRAGPQHRSGQSLPKSLDPDRAVGSRARLVTPERYLFLGLGGWASPPGSGW